MDIKLNGETRAVADGLTIGELLAELGIEPRNLAIEHNGEFLDDSAAPQTALAPGDQLEIVRFVGGG